MRRHNLCALSLASALACPFPAGAHHSYAAFDRNRIATITGTVRTWEMGNPHAYLWLFVANAAGGQDIWGFEAPSPDTLLRHGFDKYTVKVGDRLIVQFNPLRDGRHGGNLVELQFPDGRVLSAGPGNGGRPLPGQPPEAGNGADAP
jgi:hypothetical protein